MECVVESGKKWIPMRSSKFARLFGLFVRHGGGDELASLLKACLSFHLIGVDGHYMTIMCMCACGLNILLHSGLSVQEFRR